MVTVSEMRFSGGKIEMRFVRALTAAALAMSASLGNVGAAFATDAADCSCITAGPSVGQVGSIVAAKGDVLASGAKDYSLVKAGCPISVGTEISVGAKSSAQISIGSCSLPLMANSVTRVNARADGNICVASAQIASVEYGIPPASLIGSLPLGPGSSLVSAVSFISSPTTLIGMGAIAGLGSVAAIASSSTATGNSGSGSLPISR